VKRSLRDHDPVTSRRRGVTLVEMLVTLAVLLLMMTVIVQISIVSTSETALVMFTGLPGGVQVKYSASDTSPSGTLSVSAGASAASGSYPVTVTVNSAEQTASTSFTLIVDAAKS